MRLEASPRLNYILTSKLYYRSRIWNNLDRSRSCFTFWNYIYFSNLSQLLLISQFQADNRYNMHSTYEILWGSSPPHGSSVTVSHSSCAAPLPRTTHWKSLQLPAPHPATRRGDSQQISPKWKLGAQCGSAAAARDVARLSVSGSCHRCAESPVSGTCKSEAIMNQRIDWALDVADCSARQELRNASELRLWYDLRLFRRDGCIISAAPEVRRAATEFLYFNDDNCSARASDRISLSEQLEGTLRRSSHRLRITET